MTRSLQPECLIRREQILADFPGRRLPAQRAEEPLGFPELFPEDRVIVKVFDSCAFEQLEGFLRMRKDRRGIARSGSEDPRRVQPGRAAPRKVF